MARPEQRRYRRRRVNLAAKLDAGAPPSAVIDLSEGGAALAWNLRDDVAVGHTVRLRFLLPGEQSLEIEGRIVHIANGRAGVEFRGDQRNLVRQLMAEAQSQD